MNPVSPVALALLLLVALGLGLAVGVALARARGRAEREAAVAQAASLAQAELAGVRARLDERGARIAGLEAETADLKDKLRVAGADLLRASSAEAQQRQHAVSSGERAAQLDAALAAERAARETAQSEVARISDELTALRTRADAERAHASEKLRLLDEAKAALSDQFRSLANDILEEKAKRFTEQNQANLGTLLDPLRTQLSEFKGKVEEVYVQEGKDRSALAEQVRHLMELNQTLSRDATNLTNALKGSAKTQGNWGELILERVLEASGLEKGRMYHVQVSQRDAEGNLQQPDVVIDLPQDRKLVVDAKVSLVAYDRYASADADDERTQAARQHMESVRAHIKGLSDKNYQALYGLKSLDMVVMFVPIEPAFMLAVTHDESLFMEAWRRNVLLVSPSTLLFVVRTIAHLWRQEAQSRNAQDIARRGAALYDKLSSFVADLQKVGAKLKDAQSAYEEAEKKLSVGKGNVIWQAETLKGMGVQTKTAKALPASLVDVSGAADDEAGAAPPASLPLFDPPEADAPSIQ